MQSNVRKADGLRTGEQIATNIANIMREDIIAMSMGTRELTV